MEPMLLSPAGKDYMWGGTRLKKDFGKQIDMIPLAETWECSTHPDGPSVVASGEFAGRTLNEVLMKHPEYLGTRFIGKEELPILVKLIDAEQDLSVQVHPDDDYAWSHEHQSGKTEMWYILDARPGASLIHGFEHPVTKDQLRDAIRIGQLQKHLQKVPVRRGDVFFIPAGTIHAVGAGILLAEIQENSNLTYRVYDYDRADRNGKRKLQFQKAADVLNLCPGGRMRQKPRLVQYLPGVSIEMLCRCQYFLVEHYRIRKEFTFTVTEISFQVMLCLEGCGLVETGGRSRPIRLSKGACLFIPAGTGPCHVSGCMTYLKIQC